MSEGKRPGGLTALAVINFVFFGFGLLGLIGWAALFAFVGKIPTDDMTEIQRNQIEAFQEMGFSLFVAIFALSLVSNVLLLLSGIGYLKQKKVLGWMMGNAYAILSIISSIISALTFPAEIGGGFNIGIIIGLIYPIVTLALLNTTFKEDLTN